MVADFEDKSGIGNVAAHACYVDAISAAIPILLGKDNPQMTDGIAGCRDEEVSPGCNDNYPPARAL